MMSTKKVMFIVMVGSLAFGAPIVRAEAKAGAPEKETLVATLSKEQIQEFSAFIRVRDLRREELIVTTRMWIEKQRELKAFAEEMNKEFGMTPDKAYTYEIETKSLYQLSTNQVGQAGKPERKLVRKIKSDSEAQYVSRLMVARKLTEQQIQVLAQLRSEKLKEAQLLDEKLRKTFKLDPKGGYRLDDKNGQVFRLPKKETEEAPVNTGDPVPKNATQVPTKK